MLEGVDPLRTGPSGFRTVREGDRTPKGYRAADFLDVWERFLPSRPAATSATSATSQSQSQADVADVADVADRRQGSDRAALGAGDRFCDTCATPERCAADHYCLEVTLVAGRGSSAQTNAARAPRAPRASGADNGTPPIGEWLARDGVWRSLESEPPTFAGEVVETRGRP
jgi:hypothetical protein